MPRATRASAVRGRPIGLRWWGMASEVEPPDDAWGRAPPQVSATSWSMIYAELHGLAHGLMRRERGDHTLQTTALVHEAWLRVGDDPSWGSRGEFLAAAARAMRCILVDHARGRGRVKRNAGRTTEPLDDLAIADAYGEVVDLLALDAALDRLAERNELAARIVELRFFAGMAHAEIAAVCATPLRTVERTFRLARATLYRHLREPGA